MGTLTLAGSGQNFIFPARKLLNHFMKAVSAMNHGEPPIKIALSTTAVMDLWSSVIGEFNKRHQGFIQINVYSNLSAVLNGLRENRYEIAVVHEAVNDPRFVQFAICKVKLVWVAHSAFFHDSGCLPEAAQYPLLTSQKGCVDLTEYEAYIKERATNPFVRFIDAEAIKSAVIDGFGAAMLSEELVEKQIADGSLVKLEGPEPEFTISLVMVKHKRVRARLGSLLNIIAEKSTVDDGLGQFLASI
ncbi:substrate-binding domain-containing protein [Acetonema longum]|uniref:LysR family transcriptional regulator n=1 Tax=Acetonema longum DSM 6540 TaxID=1009370 RepID=F7NE14_9FIRM|nr:substrate-binding domain-containing protein [Acetonema longum]EGO65669.1 LysR family transcriptional regulator [Acetonema longum DSM 6540]